MNNKKNDNSWGVVCAGAAGTLAIVFALTTLPKQPDVEVLIETAVVTLGLVDDVKSKVGQNIPMLYEGSEYQIFLKGISKHTEVNKPAKTCYDYNISQDGVMLGVANFITVGYDQYGCTID